jgi:hypothetical protein
LFAYEQGGWFGLDLDFVVVVLPVVVDDGVWVQWAGAIHSQWAKDWMVGATLRISFAFLIFSRGSM